MCRKLIGIAKLGKSTWISTRKNCDPRGKHESQLDVRGQKYHIFSCYVQLVTQTCYLFEANDMNCDSIQILVPLRFKVYFKDLESITEQQQIDSDIITIFTPLRLTKSSSTIPIASSSLISLIICAFFCASVIALFHCRYCSFFYTLCTALHLAFFRCCYCSRFCIPFFKQLGNFYLSLRPIKNSPFIFTR